MNKKVWFVLTLIIGGVALRLFTNFKPVVAQQGVEVDPGVWVSLPAEPVITAREASHGSHLTGVNIAVDLTHNTGRQNLVTVGYQTIQSDLTDHGATLTFVTSGPLDRSVLSPFKAWWIEEDFFSTFSAPEKAALREYVDQGGCLFLNGDQLDGSVIALFDLPYANRLGSAGSTTDITPFFITNGVSQVFIPAPVNSLAPVQPAFDIIRDKAGNKMVP